MTLVWTTGPRSVETDAYQQLLHFYCHKELCSRSVEIVVHCRCKMSGDLFCKSVETLLDLLHFWCHKIFDVSLLDPYVFSLGGIFWNFVSMCLRQCAFSICIASLKISMVNLYGFFCIGIFSTFVLLLMMVPFRQWKCHAAVCKRRWKAIRGNHFQSLNIKQQYQKG